MASRISSRTRRAAAALSSTMNSQISVMSREAQNPVRSSGQTLFEQCFLALTQALEEHFPVNRLDRTALEVIIAVIEHPAYLCQFVKVASHGVLDQFVCHASGFCYPLVYLRLETGIVEVYFHAPSLRGPVCAAWRWDRPGQPVCRTGWGKSAGRCAVR